MDIWKKIWFWFRIVFIIFTLLMLVLSGFAFEYIIILFFELSNWLWDWLENR